MTVRACSARSDRCYLGYPLEITTRDVTVRDRHGRKLITVASLGAARRFLRGYRRDLPVTAEPANDPAKVLAGSDKETLHAA